MSNVCATAARMNNVTPTPACNGRINKYALDDFLDNAPDEVKDELKDVVEELAEMLSGGEE